MYLCAMFPRKKKNRTGTISVVVVDKSRGGFKEVKNFGVAKTEEEADRLYAEASEWVRRFGGQKEIDFAQSSIIQQEFLESERVLNNISAVVLNGPQQILNQVYDSIGFNRIRDEVLRHLVIARICQPLSKSATADYLKSYFHEDVSLDQIYRYMDKLYNKQRELVQQISVEHTRKILGGSIGLMFYDVTSLYFETGIQDELRTNGFSKDGKTSESQIILGLLVSADGYPLSYSIFNGGQYEGRTMIPIIDDFILELIRSLVPAFTTSIIGLVGALVVTIWSKVKFAQEEVEDNSKLGNMTPEEYIRDTAVNTKKLTDNRTIWAKHNELLSELIQLHKEQEEKNREYNDKLNDNISHQSEILKNLLMALLIAWMKYSSRCMVPSSSKYRILVKNNLPKLVRFLLQLQNV